MAKIYETQADFEKDKLTEQAGHLRLQSEKQSSFGMSLIGIGLITELWDRASKGTRGWLGYAGSIASFVGVIETVRSWFTASKAHTLELERERMGPQTVVLPRGVEVGKKEEECTPCKLKRFTHRDAKTPLEQAARADITLVRE